MLNILLADLPGHGLELALSFQAMGDHSIERHAADRRVQFGVLLLYDVESGLLELTRAVPE